MKTEKLSSLALMHSHPGAYEGGGAAAKKNKKRDQYFFKKGGFKGGHNVA